MRKTLLIGLVILLLVPFVIGLELPIFWADMKTEFGDKTGTFTTSANAPPTCGGSYCNFNGAGQSVFTGITGSFVDNRLNISMGCWENKASFGATVRVLFSGKDLAGGSAQPGIFWNSAPLEYIYRVVNITAGVGDVLDIKTSDNFSLRIMTYDGLFVYGYTNDTPQGSTRVTGGISPISDNLSIGSFPDNSLPFDGNITNCFVFDRNLTQAEVTEIFDAGFNTTFSELFNGSGDTFNLTLINVFNSSSINNFSAEITNSSSAINITTGNGTINYPQGQIINITIFNITGNEGVYFNQTFININTTTDFQATTWQSVLIVDAIELLTNLPIFNFNATVFGALATSQFNTSNSSGNVTLLLNAGDYNITARADDINTNATANLTTSFVQTSFLTLNFSSNVINVTARNKQGFASISNFNVSINQGLLFNSTTTGSLLIQCPSTGCNISVNASDFIPQEYINQNGSVTPFFANLTNRTNKFFFFDLVNNSFINGANITITSPDGRSIESLTDSTGAVNFSSMNGDVFDDGNYTIVMNSFLGFITPVTFTTILNLTTAPLNETFNVSRASINVSIFDRETGLLLNGTSVNIILLNFLNVTTTNGTFFIQNATIIPGIQVIQALASGFGTEQITFTYTNQEIININFFLLNSTGTNTGTLFASVIDEFFRIIEDASVKLLEYSTSTLSFSTVSECQSNSNGECQFLIELGVKTYILQASKNISGTVFSTQTNPEIISTDNEVRQLFLKLSDPFTIPGYTNLVITGLNESFVDNISSIFVSFTTNDGLPETVCLTFSQVFLNSRITVFESCTTSSAGTIDQSFLLNRSLTFRADIFQLTSLGNHSIETFIYPALDSFADLFERNNYSKSFVLFMWIALFTFALYIKNMSFMAVGIMMLPWLEVFMFPNLLILSGSVLKTIIGLLMYNIARRRTDLT